MLSPQEYADLSTLRESPIPISKFRKTRSFKSLKDKGCFECKYLLEDLSVFCVITTLGNDELYMFEQNQKERAEQKRKYDEQIAKADEDRKKQFKHDWLVAIFSAVIGFILGLIVEHFIDIVAFFF